VSRLRCATSDRVLRAGARSQSHRKSYVQALAIIRARARKQRRVLLGLADNGANLVLTLPASVLAIIVSCSPTDAG
jgi:hypothetical protein